MSTLVEITVRISAKSSMLNINAGWLNAQVSKAIKELAEEVKNNTLIEMTLPLIEYTRREGSNITLVSDYVAGDENYRPEHKLPLPSGDM